MFVKKDYTEEELEQARKGFEGKRLEIVDEQGVRLGGGLFYSLGYNEIIKAKDGSKQLQVVIGRMPCRISCLEQIKLVVMPEILVTGKVDK